MSEPAVLPANEQPERAHARRRWWGLVVVTTAQLMVVLDTTIVTIALPSAQGALHMSVTERQWVITAYTVAFGGLLLLGGRVGDLIGRRRSLLIGVIGFALASALGGAAVDPGMLIAARALQGVFAAMLAPSTLALLSVTFVDPGERAKAFGVFSSGLMSGAAIGLVLGGALTEYLNWRWCLYVNIVIAIAVVIGTLLLLPDPAPNREVRLDVPGTLLGCGGMVALVYALGEGGVRGWGSPLIIGLLVGAVVLLGTFGYVQSVVSHPLLPLRVLANRNRVGAFTGVAIASFGMLGMFLFMTFELQTVLHYSSLIAGLAFLPYVAATIIAATQIAGRLLPHVPPRALAAPGLLLQVAGLLVLTQLTPQSSYAANILPALLLFGLGGGSLIAPCMSTATSVGDPRDAGVASAFVNTSQQIGGSIGTALLNTIAVSAASAYLVGRSPDPQTSAAASVHGYVAASGWGALVLLVGVLLTGLLINAPSPKQRAAAGRSAA